MSDDNVNASQNNLEELRQMTTTDSQQLAESIAAHGILAKWEGHGSFKRVEAFEALDGERRYQEQFNSNVLSVGEELCLLQCYINKAMVEYATTLYAPSEPATMDVIRKIGAMCLRAMENHGSIEREGYNIPDTKTLIEDVKAHAERDTYRKHSELLVPSEDFKKDLVEAEQEVKTHIEEAIQSTRTKIEESKEEPIEPTPPPAEEHGEADVSDRDNQYIDHPKH